MNDKNHHRQFSSYYQAKVDPKQTWYVVGILRSFEHMVFDRTLDVQKGLFEFFVPQGTESYFLDLIDYFQKENIISGLQKKQNRLMDQQEHL